MAGVFDEEYSQSAYDTEEESNAAAESVVNQLTDETIDEAMSEAEARYRMAGYYKSVVANGVVEDDGSSEAARVNEQARAWARSMMGDLLGVAKPAPEPVKVELPFSEHEIRALKKLAGLALARAGEAPPAAEPKPVVNRLVAPEPKPVVQPAPKPVVKKPQPKQPAPVAKPATNSKKPVPKPPKGSKHNYEALQQSGQPFVDTDGVMYRFVANPNYIPGIEKMEGFQGEKDGRLRQFIKRKMTGSARGRQPIPMPRPEQMAGITAAQSMETVNAGASANATETITGSQASQGIRGIPAYVAAAAAIGASTTPEE